MKNFYHLYYDALLRRFTGSSEELYNFQTRIDRTTAGMAGEQRVYQDIEDCMSGEPFALLHGLQFINHNNIPHQIDLLLLTTRYILVIEVKNISGTLFYDKELRQFSRTLFDDKHEFFANPFDQLLRHHEYVYYLLKNANIKVPVSSLIINSNTNATMDQSLRGEAIININSLRNTLNNLQHKYPQIMAANGPERLKHFFESKNVFYEATRYIPLTSIQSGVLCPTCDFKNLMVYDSRTWRCFSCKQNNRKALKLALRDYRILVGDTITNEKFRDWTGISNPYTASKILRNLNFPASGKTRSRIYTIPQEYMFLEIE